MTKIYMKLRILVVKPTADDLTLLLFKVAGYNGEFFNVMIATISCPAPKRALRNKPMIAIQSMFLSALCRSIHEEILFEGGGFVATSARRRSRSPQ